MGLGGDLMWTPVAYEIFKKTGKITCFVKKIKNRKKIIIDDPSKLFVWKHLPYILNGQNQTLTYEDVINDDKYHIIDKSIRPDLKNKKPNIQCHTIISRCAHFNYFKPNLHIYMEFSNEEKDKIKNIIRKLPKKFIVIEPHAKTSWCEHKQYPITKWQKIVNTFYKKIPFVQMSLPGNKVLNNVIDIGKEIHNFREACLLLKYAHLFMSSEGGLMHGARVHKTKCLMVYCPMFDPIWTKYDNVIVEWVHSKEHKNCFQEGTCPKCCDLMNKHDENKIINKITNYLKL